MKFLWLAKSENVSSLNQISTDFRMTLKILQWNGLWRQLRLGKVQSCEICKLFISVGFPCKKDISIIFDQNYLIRLTKAPYINDMLMEEGRGIVNLRWLGIGVVGKCQAAVPRCIIGALEQFRNIHRKTPVLESLFIKLQQFYNHFHNILRLFLQILLIFLFTSSETMRHYYL